MSIRVYRIEVTRWPTPDGEPWERAYGPSAYQSYDVPEWLEPRLNSPDWRVQTRVQYDDADEIALVVMPKPKRVNYLSASGAAELAANMRAFGAEVTVHRSEPVRWSA